MAFRSLTLLSLLAVFCTTLWADASIGARFRGLKSGFSYGVELTTPRLFRVWETDVALRASVDGATFEGRPLSGGNEKQFLYAIVDFGTVLTHGYITDKIRLYSEWGVAFFFPESALASSTTVDVYTFGGIEYYLKPKLSSFVQFGGTYFSFAEATGVVGQPNYTTGFSTTVGGRLYF